MRFPSTFVLAVSVLAACVSLAGCPGMTAPAPAGAPSSPRSEVSSPGETPAADAVAEDGPMGGDSYAAADSKPHPGGVSALPADWGGDEGKKSFDFTLTGDTQAVCESAAKDGDGVSSVRYSAKGAIGATLLDGTQVDVYHCEVLVVHFQVGAGSSAYCQDLSVNEDCSFSGNVSFPAGSEAPAITLFGKFYQHPKPVCGETQWLRAPGKTDMAFSAPDDLPVCSPLKMPSLKGLPQIFR